MGIPMDHISTATTQTRIIRSDAEALQVAARLAASF